MIRFLCKLLTTLALALTVLPHGFAQPGYGHRFHGDQARNYRPLIYLGLGGGVAATIIYLVQTGRRDVAIDRLRGEVEPGVRKDGYGIPKGAAPGIFHRKPVSSYREAGIQTHPGKAQDIAAAQARRGLKPGILVLSNAGRPGGAVGRMKGTGIHGAYLDGKYPGGQEESVVISWLLAVRQYGMDPHQVFRDTLGTGRPGGRPFGLLDPDLRYGRRKFTHTVQGKDFTLPFSGSYRTQSPHYYYNAYCVSRQPVMDSRGGIAHNVDLVFVYGPNICAVGRPEGSMARTKVSHYSHHRDYPLFRESVKQAYLAGLRRMADTSVQVPVLGRISSGIYSKGVPATCNAIHRDYPAIVDEVLNSLYKNRPLRSYFQQVVMSTF